MSGTLHLAQALSNRRRRGRKKDFRDAERLGKRLVSGADFELRARYRTATAEDTHTHKISTDAGTWNLSMKSCFLEDELLYLANAWDQHEYL